MTKGYRKAMVTATAFASTAPLVLAAVVGTTAAESGRVTSEVRISGLEVIAKDSNGGRLLTTELLSSRRGHVALVWKSKGGHVTAVRRTPSGTWLHPSDLGEGSWPDAAMDAGGRVTVAWWRNGRCEVVSGRSTHTGWKPTAVIYRTPDGSNRRAGNPDVAVNPRGDAFVAWWSGTAYDFFDRQTGPSGREGQYGVTRTKRGMRAAVRPHDGDWSPAEWMPLHGSLVAPFVDSDGRAVALRQSHGQLSLLTRLSQGSWRGQTGVALEGSSIWEASRNPSGDIVISATEDATLVQAVQKEGDGDWFPAVTIAESTGTPNRLPVVVDGIGHAAILYVATNGTAAAVTRNARGEWSAPVLFAGHADHVNGLRLAAGPRGALTAVWREGSDSLWAAYRPSAQAAWADPVLLTRSRDPGRGVLRPDVTFAGNGAFLAVWASSAGQTTYFLGRTIDRAA